MAHQLHFLCAYVVTHGAKVCRLMVQDETTSEVSAFSGVWLLVYCQCLDRVCFNSIVVSGTEKCVARHAFVSNGICMHNHY